MSVPFCVTGVLFPIYGGGLLTTCFPGCVYVAVLEQLPPGGSQQDADMPPVHRCLYEQGLCEASLGYQQQACCLGTVIL